MFGAILLASKILTVAGAGPQAYYTVYTDGISPIPIGCEASAGQRVHDECCTENPGTPINGLFAGGACGPPMQLGPYTVAAYLECTANDRFTYQEGCYQYDTQAVDCTKCKYPVAADAPYGCYRANDFPDSPDHYYINVMGCSGPHPQTTFPNAYYSIYEDITNPTPAMCEARVGEKVDNECCTNNPGDPIDGIYAHGACSPPLQMGPYTVAGFLQCNANDRFTYHEGCYDKDTSSVDCTDCHYPVVSNGEYGCYRGNDFPNSPQRFFIYVEGCSAPPPAESCTIEDTVFRGTGEKRKASSAEECYEKCLAEDDLRKGKPCRGWSYKEGWRKSCKLYTNNRRRKENTGVLSGKANCSPTKGKIRRKQ